MTAQMLVEGLTLYLCFIIALSFHECAHAWMASRSGDETARRMGRLTLNPMAHIDTLGTVILPLAMIFLPMMGTTGAAISGFVIGWAKPVPINPSNFRKGSRDENLVSLAGPLSNLLLGFIIMVGIRIIAGIGFVHGGFMAGLVDVLWQLTLINILLAWFNLIPIPPLDGSHLLKNLTRMDIRTYLWLSQWGIWILILALNFTPLHRVLTFLISSTLVVMMKILGM